MKRPAIITAGAGGIAAAVALTASLCLGGAGRCAGKTVAPHAASPRIPASIQWNSSFDGAVREARASGRPIMVDFFATWCPPCKMLAAHTYTDPRVIRAAQGFIAARVDVDKQPELAARYGANSLPSVLFFRSNGEPAAGFQGYVGADQMVGILARPCDSLETSGPLGRRALR